MMNGFRILLGGFIVAFILGMWLFFPLFRDKTGYEILTQQINQQQSLGNEYWEILERGDCYNHYYNSVTNQHRISSKIGVINYQDEYGGWNPIDTSLMLDKKTGNYIVDKAPCGAEQYASARSLCSCHLGQIHRAGPRFL